ncbi:MAG: hypothetical protein WAW07_07475 [Bacteroidales bacterium]
MKFSVPTSILLASLFASHPVEAGFRNFTNRDDFLILSRDIENDDNLIIILSREYRPSFQESMSRVPHYLIIYFQSNSYMMLYPMQSGVGGDFIDLINPSCSIRSKSLMKSGRI